MSEDNKRDAVRPVQGYIPHSQPPQTDDQIDLRELWDIVWAGKWFITASVITVAIISLIVAITLPNIYRSEALLAPSEEAQGGGLSGMVGQLGGLASLAGINLAPGQGESKVAVAIEVVKSRKFVGEFIDKHNALPELMGVKGWSRATGELIYNPKMYNQAEDEWVRDVEPPKTPKPSAWEAYDAFTDIMTISQDKETGFITVTVEHYSPFVAQRWAELLVQDINKVMRDKEVNEAQRSINFLERRLAEVALAEMRSVFYELIEEQTKTVMLAEVRDEYIFSTIDPPVVAEEKSWPQRALICVLGVFLGGMVGVMIVFVRHLVLRK